MRSNITVLFALLFSSVVLVSSAPAAMGMGEIKGATGSNAAAARAAAARPNSSFAQQVSSDLARANSASNDLIRDSITSAQHRQDQFLQDQADKKPLIWRGNPRVPRVSTTSNLAVPTGA